MGARYNKIAQFVADNQPVQIQGRLGARVNGRFRLVVDQVSPPSPGIFKTFALSSATGDSLELMEEEIADVVLQPDTGALQIKMDDGNSLIMQQVQTT